MTLGEATRLYQAAQAELLSNPDDEGLAEQVARAYEEVEVLWCNLLLGEIRGGR